MSHALRKLNVDLHSHSTVSDGTLSPAAMVERAHAQNVDLFALTDHDELSGLSQAQARAAQLGLRFLPGVEISVTFAGETVHVVGLGVDPTNPALNRGLQSVRGGRLQRGQEMAAALAVIGIEGSLEGALSYAGNPELLSRTHFARYLVEQGYAADTREVFNKYLSSGKPGYVPHRWASLENAVSWIRGAGGVAVIAHPGRYRISDTVQWALFSEFKDAGGEGIEVATSNHTRDQLQQFAALAQEFGFDASRGSDFHGPGESHAELGVVAALPDTLRPVWHRYL